MSDVHLKFIDRVHIKILSEASTIMELADAFTWKADGYKFNPKYKARLWDGNISLINRMSGTCYAGLAQRIKKFCDARGYSFSFDNELLYENVSEHELTEFIASLNIPEKYQQRDFQSCRLRLTGSN